MHAHIIVTVVIVTWIEYKTEILVILHSKSPVPLQISWTNKAVDNYNLIRGWWLDNTADLLQIISFQNWPNIIYFKISPTDMYKPIVKLWTVGTNGEDFIMDPILQGLAILIPI